MESGAASHSIHSMQLIADKFKYHLIQWQYARNEYAEILKAETQAKVEGVEQSNLNTITGRRLEGDRNAIEWTKESIDFKAKIEVHEKWMWFYALLIDNSIAIDVSDCP